MVRQEKREKERADRAARKALLGYRRKLTYAERLLERGVSVAEAWQR